MPYYRVPKSNALEHVAAIERNGEHVVTALDEGDTYAIFTRVVISTPPRSYETRGAA